MKFNERFSDSGVFVLDRWFEFGVPVFEAQAGGSEVESSFCNYAAGVLQCSVLSNWYLDDLTSLVHAWLGDHSLSNSEGRLMKRLSRAAFKAGVTIPPNILQQIGNSVDRFIVPQTKTTLIPFPASYVRKSSEWGNAGSCWFSSFENGRYRFITAGGIVLRIIQNDQPAGRVFLAPIDHESDSPAALFNCYGLTLRNLASMLSSAWSVSESTLQVNSPAFYVNNSEAVILHKESLSVGRIDFSRWGLRTNNPSWTMTIDCDNCAKPLALKTEFKTDGGACLCPSCVAAMGQCPRCRRIGCELETVELYDYSNGQITVESVPMCTRCQGNLIRCAESLTFWRSYSHFQQNRSPLYWVNQGMSLADYGGWSSPDQIVRVRMLIDAASASSIREVSITQTEFASGHYVMCPVLNAYYSRYTRKSVMGNDGNVFVSPAAYRRLRRRVGHVCSHCRNCADHRLPSYDNVLSNQWGLDYPSTVYLCSACAARLVSLDACVNIYDPPNTLRHCTHGGRVIPAWINREGQAFTRSTCRACYNEGVQSNVQ